MNSFNLNVFMPFYVHEDIEIVPALHHGHSFQSTNKKRTKYLCVYCGMSTVCYYSCKNTNTAFVNQFVEFILCNKYQDNCVVKWSPHNTINNWGKHKGKRYSLE